LDSTGEWRVIDPAQDEARQADDVSKAEDKSPRWLIGVLSAIVLAGLAVAIWVTLPAGGATVDGTDSRTGVAPRGVVDIAGSARPSSVAAVVLIVVDVEGAVADPGLHQLRADDRVGDAIAAAGGYATNVDIEAAGRALNLAAKLTDGQQVRVPALGESVPAPASSGIGADPGMGSDGGLIDINHAAAEELDTLPGIGPVTAAKIIDARTEAPFATIDELQSRGVLGQSTFDKLRDLITVTP
jgi:competence protein ComEA